MEEIDVNKLYNLYNSVHGNKDIYKYFYSDNISFELNDIMKLYDSLIYEKTYSPPKKEVLTNGIPNVWDNEDII